MNGGKTTFQSRVPRYHRIAEALRERIRTGELALIVESRAGRQLAGPDSLAQRLGDAVIARHSTLERRLAAVHRTSVF